ncbi:MAG: hypothetical protein ACD_57C00003G0003, partial [uncultured bacterium]
SKIVDVSRVVDSSKIKQLIVIGIGGSSLGTKALLGAIPSSSVKVTFLENIEKEMPELLSENYSEVLVNVVSKSGDTFETLTNLDKLLAKYPQLKDRIIITTAHPEKFEGYAKEYFLPIPPQVSGRYSVFTPVGLFPLSLTGFNILSLLEGAMSARKDCLQEGSANPALVLAVVQYFHYIKKRTIDVNFFFHPTLELLGKWNNQIVAESLGKNGKGLTPLVSIGTTDLHSMIQLFLDGPKDKFTEFVYCKKLLPKEDLPVIDGVKKSYENRKLPFISWEFDDLTEKSLGYYMQVKMISVVFLAKLMGVNAFDQPAVEEYKKYAKENS